MVTSPNFPAYYPNSLEKTETIHVEQGLILSLEFTAFDIDYIVWQSTCILDYLIITDGDGTTLMERSCGSSSEGNVQIGGLNIGSSLPPNVISRSSIVNFIFETSPSNSKSGWSVSWSAVTPGERQQIGWIFLDKFFAPTLVSEWVSVFIFQRQLSHLPSLQAFLFWIKFMIHIYVLIPPNQALLIFFSSTS